MLLLRNTCNKYMLMGCCCLLKWMKKKKIFYSFYKFNLLNHLNCLFFFSLIFILQKGKQMYMIVIYLFIYLHKIIYFYFSILVRLYNSFSFHFFHSVFKVVLSFYGFITWFLWLRAKNKFFCFFFFFF